MICYEIGHRAKFFPFSETKNQLEFVFYLNELFYKIEHLIHSGYSTFISGMADGADTDFAETVMYFRDRALYDISLEAVLPYVFTSSKKTTSEYSYLLSMSDDIHVTSEHYRKGCIRKKHELMIDKADLVLAIWNGKKQGSVWNTIKYAIQKGKPIEYIFIK